MPRYAVTLTAQIWITAQSRAEAVRICNDDAREFVAQNEDVQVANIQQVSEARIDLTESLDAIEFRDSRVVDPARKGSIDWTMQGVYDLIVDAADAQAAEAAAKALPKQLTEHAPSPSM